MEKLQDYYNHGERVAIETDLTTIKEYLLSRASACWGQYEIPDTGYYQLVMGSSQRKGGSILIIVCSMINFNKIKKEQQSG